MPFTISHAAAIIPFNKKPLVLSALIIGSMSPDFLYYLPIDNLELTHTLKGLLLFCLPTSLIVLLVYHRLLKEPLISLLPKQLQSRLQVENYSFKFLPVPQLLWISLSILIGSATHIIWDSFTHIHGYSVLRIPVLSQKVFQLFGQDYHVYKLLQYLSSIGGLAIFTAWFAWLISKEKPKNINLSFKDSEPTWLLVVMLSVATIFGILFSWTTTNLGDIKVFVVTSITSAMTCFLAFWFIYSCKWYIQKFNQNSTNT